MYTTVESNIMLTMSLVAMLITVETNSAYNVTASGVQVVEKQ